MAASTALAAIPYRASAQEVTLRWWSPQSAPLQLEAYNFQIAAFEAANPGIKVEFEATSDEGYAPQLAAAFSSGEVPDLVTHLPSFSIHTYYSNGLVEPMNDVINAVGADDFFDGANDVYKAADGNYVATGIGNVAANMLWLRTDLMKEAGIDNAPTTWDELRAACQAMQKNGIYGAPLPYGRNSMTTRIFVGVMHQAGATVFTPDLEVAIDSQETRDALEWYASMRELCPPGATNYSWGEAITAFVSGATATGIYTGRVLGNVNSQNPGIADSITCVRYPTISADVKPWTFNAFPSVFIPAQSKQIEAAKKFATHLFEPEGHIKQLHAAPGHLLPVLRSINSSPIYQDNPIIKKYPGEVSVMAAAAADGHNLGYESKAHKSNDRAGDVEGTGAIADMVQRVVLNKENPDVVIGETAKIIEDAMKG
jgi:multiple sugar transport system substrate-binding protein